MIYHDARGDELISEVVTPIKHCMKGIICVEGPDGAGKSTLVNNLLQEFGGTTLKASAKWLDRMDVYHTALFNRALELSENELVILDRWWPSEYVYAPIYRPNAGGCSKWRMYGRWLDMEFTIAGGLYVFVLPDVQVALSRLKHRGAKNEFDAADNRWINVYSRYQALVRGSTRIKERTHFGDVCRSGGLVRRENLLVLPGGASKLIPIVAERFSDLHKREFALSIRQLRQQFF